ncbi:Fic family protein [Kribbella sp. NPDC048928]|uniref:Fic family protein n=1 Tax=Kribbella sp. NPDC048928 TaxID=3364111 RepID=UPI00372422ED
MVLLRIESILAAHRALMHDQTYARPGQLRDGQVWIGGGPTPHTAAFVPPRHERVLALMDDLVAFCRRTDVPVLTQVSIAHAQFETIHPFNDGNGRTGRTLVHAMLRRSGVTRRLTVPVSAGLLTDTDAYFAALGSYREGDPTPIITQFSRASFAAVGSSATSPASTPPGRTPSRRGRVRPPVACCHTCSASRRSPSRTSGSTLLSHNPLRNVRSTNSSTHRS